MIDDTDGEEWVYRRDPRMRRPITSLAGPASDERRAVLAPEVQLLQKSKGRRLKDEADFGMAAPLLSTPARSWLRDALDLVSPGHDWAAALR